MPGLSGSLGRLVAQAAAGASGIAALAGLGAWAAPAAGQGPATLVSSTFHAGTNSIDMPGIGVRTFISYNGLFRSPNGRRWVFIGNLEADTPIETATNRAIVAGSLDAPTFSQGQVIVHKGDAIPGSTRTVNILDNPKINDAGQFIFSTNSSGTGSPSVFFMTGSVAPTPTFGVAAAIGEPVPFLTGATYSGGFNSTLLDNTGRWGFASSINEASVVTRAVVFNGGIVARSADAATAPTRLTGSDSDPWSDFTLRRVFVNGQGTGFYWLGTAATGGGPVDMAALDNVAVAEEGSPLPNGVGGGATVATIFSGWYDPEGAWYLRGTFADIGGNDFVLRNGTIVAQFLQPIVPGSAELWSRPAGSTANGFLFAVGNGRGDYAIAGSTVDGTGTVVATAVVLNGQTVVAHKGDPIDGNGMLDDDMFITGFKSEIGPGTAFLTDDGWLWMVVDVGNEAGTDLGDAIIRKRVFTPCPADFNGSGSVTVQDIFDFLAAYFSLDPRADFNGVGGVTVQDIFDYLAAYFAGCG